jgi:hypothetical protein
LRRPPGRWSGSSAQCVGAGQTVQAGSAIAIGSNAGQSTQGESAVAIGDNAGQNTQGPYAIAIGPYAGQNTQGPSAIAIGDSTGQEAQGARAIAIGPYSGQTKQGGSAVAIGYSAGQSTQGESAVAIGDSTGQDSQGIKAIAIGFEAGKFIQGSEAITIGYGSGQHTQGPNAIAIGASAGQMIQGESAIAIGSKAGQTNQPNNSIVLNASGLGLNGATASAFYVRPVRSTASTLKTLMYDDTNYEVVYSASAKTFVIDHPVDKDKLLVHACLEGPEAGVYYRGRGEIVNGERVEIELPQYVNTLCTDLTIQLTPIYNGNNSNITLYTSDVENNKFTVYSSKNIKFFWIVHGKRSNITTEPLKENTIINGCGPYKWI